VKPMDIALAQMRALQNPNMSNSVMSRNNSSVWQPEYEKEPPLEQVSPEDFVPSPKSLIAALKGVSSMGAGLGIRALGGGLHGLPMTSATKKFTSSGEFADQFNNFAKDTGLKWWERPAFQSHDNHITFHDQDLPVVQRFLQYLGEAPPGERASIPPGLRTGTIMERE
jgi:hypothetical protein